ncbi:MAG TPA: branched-chain amino acid ABC transporter permease [Mycobacteriales bacterium]|nr:branched-chain amino acid ABC transporter permease [Mycobacteriales bacterium]
MQQIVDGITAGSIYAALALALVLVHRATGLVNFAQGQMAAVSVYIGWSLVSSGVPVVPAVLLTLVVSLAIGALTERLLIRRFEGSEPLVAIVATVAVLICFNGLISLVWGGSVRSFPSMFPDGVVSILGARATWGDVGTVGVLVGTVGVLQLLFLRTRLGLALRTAADSQDSARLLGLPVGSLLLVGWGLAALVGGLAGCLVAPSVPLQPNMMDTILVYALAAAVLGGLDSPLGAVLAAWFIGIAETVAGANIDLIGSDLRIAVPLVLLVLILLVRPQGLFGRRDVERL